MNEPGEGHEDALLALLKSLYGDPSVKEILKKDLEFAQFLLSRRLVSRTALEECLKAQKRAAESGRRPIPRLRGLLIQMGAMTDLQVDQALESLDATPSEVPKPDPSNRIGPYVLMEKVGSGGMGEVWKAWDTNLGRHVALKFLIENDPRELARFTREAELAAKLSHPNIAAIYEMRMDGTRRYLALEYVDGTTLDKFPRKDRQLLVRLIRDAARALDYAHQQGIVHRDIKPSNLMVSRQEGKGDHVFVLDFGLARKLEGAAKVTASGVALGTPAYMSPEQARGLEVDSRSDVYGLGATLYELLANRPPFGGKNVYELLKRVEEKDPGSLRRTPRPVDSDLETIVLKCLEKNPSRRYESARALADDLDRYLAKEPILARAPSVVYRLRKGLAKRKALAAITLVAVALAASAVLLGKRATSAEAQALTELQRQTQTALMAVMELRRAGHTEQAKPFVVRTEEACQEAINLLPTKAEPHYLLGRMYRAVMHYENALEEQNRALEKEREHAPSLYERVVLRVRLHRRRMEEVVQSDRADVGLRLFGDKEVKTGVKVEPPDLRKLSELDDVANGLMKRMFEDLRALERVGNSLGEGEKSCARGLLAWAERNYERAVTHLNAALKTAPALEEVYEALAILHEEQGRYEESIKLWTAGLDRDRGYVPFLVGRASVRVNWGYSRYLRGESHSDLYLKGIEDLDQALKHDASVSLTWHMRGVAKGNLATSLAARGEDPTKLFEGAISDFDEAVRLNPASFPSWRGRGIVRWGLGKHVAATGGDPSKAYEQVVNDFDGSLNLNPGDVETWKSRGLVRSDWGLFIAGKNQDPSQMYRKAVEDYGEALKRDPGHAESWKGRGGVRVNWGMYSQSRGEDPSALFRGAIEDIGEALKLDPESATAWQWRGNAYLNSGIFIKSRRGDPSDVYERAIQDYGESLKRHPSNAATLKGRGAAYSNLGNYKLDNGKGPTNLLDEALKDLARSLEINRNDPIVWLFQGHAYYSRGWHKMDGKVPAGADFRAAKSSYEEAARLNRDLEAKLRPYIGDCLEYFKTHPDE